MPSTDVTEADKEIEIKAELPGLEVQVNFADVLTIRGEKEIEKEEKDKNLALPDGVNPKRLRRQSL